MLRAAHASRRVRLTDDQGRRLAVKGVVLGRRRLTDVSWIVTPDTILRWYGGSSLRNTTVPTCDGPVARLQGPISLRWWCAWRRRIRPGATRGSAGGSRPSATRWPGTRSRPFSRTMASRLHPSAARTRRGRRLSPLIGTVRGSRLVHRRGADPRRPGPVQRLLRHEAQDARVHPDTVVRWHRQWLRRRWTRRSRRARPGRPRTDAALRALVMKVAAANPLWGAPRIHGALGKLGVAVSERTVSRLVGGRYSRRRRPGEPFSRIMSGR